MQASIKSYDIYDCHGSFIDREFKSALQWELYKDDLVVIAATENHLIKRLNGWGIEA